MRPPPPTWVRLAGVLLEVGPLDADARAVGQLEPAVDVDRLVVLADLVVLRHVRVEVVLPGERSTARTVQLQGQPEPHGQLDRLLVEHRQRARAGRGTTGSMLVLGSSPNRFGQPQNILVAVASSAWTSRPTTISQSAGRRSGRRSRSIALIGGARFEHGGGSEHRSPRRASGPSTCTPTGRPSAPVPNGTLIAGWPARFDGIVHMSLRYMPAGRRSWRRTGRRRSARSATAAGRTARRPRSKSSADQRADLQRLAVVGVVVAGRQGVGAEHDAPLHLVAEAGGAGGGVSSRRWSAASTRRP